MYANKIRKWDTLADTWDDAGPPASPSAEEIMIYKRFLRRSMEDVDNPKIMILGSTPRLRVLVSQLEVPVTCVDMSKRMLAKTSRLVSPRNSRERLVCQDWLRLHLPETKFSAIVGDMILDNIPYQRWSDLKERLIAHLKNGGFVITRVAPPDSSLRGRSFGSLLKQWATQYADGLIPLQQAAVGLWVQALGASAQSIPGRQCLSVFDEEIKFINETPNRLTRSEAALIVEFIKLFRKNLKYEWTAYTLENVIDAFAEELTLVNVGKAHDYASAQRQPILMFQYSG